MYLKLATKNNKKKKIRKRNNQTFAKFSDQQKINNKQKKNIKLKR